MKKFVSALLALILCMSVAALAADYPSKSTADMIQIGVTAEFMPADSGFYIKPVNEMTVEELGPYQELIDVCNEEIQLLSKAESVLAYFANVKYKDGTPLTDPGMEEEFETPSLPEMVGVDANDLTVYEFFPVIAGLYTDAYGMVTMQVITSTPYAVDEKVAVMIGFYTEDENGVRTVEWFAYEGVAVAIDGYPEHPTCIEVVLDPEIVLAIQEKNALMAVVSSEHEEELV